MTLTLELTHYGWIIKNLNVSGSKIVCDLTNQTTVFSLDGVSMSSGYRQRIFGAYVGVHKVRASLGVCQNLGKFSPTNFCLGRL